MQKTDLIIIGAGGHCRAVLAVFMANPKWNLRGIIDLSFLGQSESILGVPIIGGIDLLETIQASDTCVFIAVGDNDLRLELAKISQRKSYQLVNAISPRAEISPTAFIGIGVFVAPFAFVGPECKVGDNAILNTGSVIEHESVIGANTHVAPNATIAGRCQIGDSCLIGASATVIQSKTVVGGTIVGANSTITKNVSEPGLYIGSPARKVTL